MYLHKISCVISLVLFIHTANAQVQNDSILRNIIANTTIGGYGDASYQNDLNAQTSTVNLNRFVLFIGHQFNSKIAFFSELEVEDAKVEGGDNGGEIALEQAYLEFQLNKRNYLVAGLYIPRIGILNEDHLPTSYNGVERNRVETLLIPSTWREIGIGLYGSASSLPFNYYLGLTNGLNSASFEHGSGIRGGRYEGRNASANNLALSGAIQFNPGHFQFQLASYYGGTVGLAKKVADTMNLKAGMLGTPVMISEAHAIYGNHGFNFRLLGTLISIPDAEKINTAYQNNTPEKAFGGYAEAGYNLLQTCNHLKPQKLILFARYEFLNLNAKLPINSINDPTLNQQHIVAGLTYLPINNVVIKTDVRLFSSGKPDSDNINPADPMYESRNTLFNLGIGFSF